MASLVTPITVEELTTKALDGTGVFDTLMIATRQHLEREFQDGRIKHQEYAEVYLGSLTQVLQTSVSFLLTKDDSYQKALLTEAQVRLAEIQLEIAGYTKELTAAQVDKTKQETKNLILEGANLERQGCILDAQFDLLKSQILQTEAQIALTEQKKLTEKAQISGNGVDPDSVIGKQKALYQAQTDGFARDAEQKAAKLLIDTWNVRRTTDDGTVADGTNMLNDATIGRAVNKVLAGVGA